jgi:hypothetical protein
MLNHRAFLILVSLAIASIPAPARASCAAVNGCVCDFGLDRVASFTGTVLEGQARAFDTLPMLQIRIDEVTVADGMASALTPGSITTSSVISTEISVRAGDRILGYTTPTCASPGTQGCTDQPLDHEDIIIRTVLDAAGLVPCGPISFASPDARALLLDPDCEAKLHARLGTENVTPACHDTFPLCSAPAASVGSGASTGGLSAIVGVAAIVAASRLRRRRR